MRGMDEMQKSRVRLIDGGFCGVMRGRRLRDLRMNSHLIEVQNGIILNNKRWRWSKRLLKCAWLMFIVALFLPGWDVPFFAPQTWCILVLMFIAIFQIFERGIKETKDLIALLSASAICLATLYFLVTPLWFKFCQSVWSIRIFKWMGITLWGVFALLIVDILEPESGLLAGYYLLCAAYVLAFVALWLRPVPMADSAQRGFPVENMNKT